LDIKLKKYSHLLTTKIVVFIMMILCFTGIIKAFVDVEIVNDGDFGIVFEEDYFHSREYVRESDVIIGQLTRLLKEFKSEEHIVNGGSISEDEVRSEEETLYSDFQIHSRNFNPNLSEKENYDKFKTEYANKISQARDKLIKNDLREFHLIVQNLRD
jgi:hypothetical protein